MCIRSSQAPVDVVVVLRNRDIIADTNGTLYVILERTARVLCCCPVNVRVRRAETPERVRSAVMKWRTAPPRHGESLQNAKLRSCITLHHCPTLKS